jgi:hypothetical protein
MKKHTKLSLVALTLLACFGSSLTPAHAKERTKKASALAKVSTLAPDAPSADESRSPAEGKPRFGLGLASVSGLTQTQTAITGWFELDRKNAFQGFIGFGGTSPVQIMGAALFKHLLAESGNAGFHLGGGFGIGATSAAASTAFGLTVTGVMGVRYSLGENSRTILQFDGGPLFSLVGSSSNFTIGALSANLGASIIYNFN